jgi:hypothetical protein
VRTSLDRRELNTAAGLAAVVGLVLVYAVSGSDGTTLLIGLTGLVVFGSVLGYFGAALWYAPRSSLRVAVALAAGWLLLPFLLYGAVVLVWGSPGGGAVTGPPATRTTTVTYRNGTEVGRSTDSGSGSGGVPGLLVAAYCVLWPGSAAYLVYLGYRGPAGPAGGDPPGGPAPDRPGRGE